MPDENLWPEFLTEPPPRTIGQVLRESGEGIAARTDNRIHFIVRSKHLGNGRFVHDCFLHVPSADYRYPFLKVTEQGDPYPVTVVGDAMFHLGVSAANEEALKQNLKLLFGNDSTKRTVQQLLEMVV